MERKIIIISIIITSMVMLMSCGNNQNKENVDSSEYPISTITRQSVVQKQLFPATIRGQEDIEIRPRIDGFIQEIYIDEGSIVKKGQRRKRNGYGDNQANV